MPSRYDMRNPMNAPSENATAMLVTLRDCAATLAHGEPFAGHRPERRMAIPDAFVAPRSTPSHSTRTSRKANRD